VVCLHLYCALPSRFLHASQADRAPYRMVFPAIVYAPCTGIQRNALPRESISACEAPMVAPFLGAKSVRLTWPVLPARQTTTSAWRPNHH
jgi:hypothetical protein